MVCCNVVATEGVPQQGFRWVKAQRRRAYRDAYVAALHAAHVSICVQHIVHIEAVELDSKHIAGHVFPEQSPAVTCKMRVLLPLPYAPPTHPPTLPRTPTGVEPRVREPHVHQRGGQDRAAGCIGGVACKVTLLWLLWRPGTKRVPAVLALLCVTE